MSLVVDDGTGLANAESYVSVADASAYFGKFYLPNDPLMVAWTAALVSPGTNAEVALRRSTRDLDVVYGPSYLSYALTSTQALLFPRTSFYEYGNSCYMAEQSWDGYYYPVQSNAIQVTGIPAALANATAELALILLNGYDVTGPSDRSGAISRNYLRVGPLLDEQQYFYAASAAAMNTRKVSALMAPFISDDPFGITVGLVRG